VLRLSRTLAPLQRLFYLMLPVLALLFLALGVLAAWTAVKQRLKRLWLLAGLCWSGSIALGLAGLARIWRDEPSLMAACYAGSFILLGVALVCATTYLRSSARSSS